MSKFRFVRASLLVAGAFACAAHAQPIAKPATPVADGLLDAFEHPPKSARPDARWWWPGDAVSDAELQRQVAVLDKAGFGGAEIQSFNPGIPDLRPDERASANGYAEPSFFTHVDVAAAAARAHGLQLDYTFGSAWPSGGGLAITPELALVELTMAVTSVNGNIKGPLKITVPARTKRLGAFSLLDPWTKSPEGKAWKARFDAQAKIVSVMAFQGTPPILLPKPKAGIELSPWSDVATSGIIDPATRIDLTARMKPDGTLDWTPPPGEWQVFVFKQYASNSSVLGASGTGPQLVLDHFDRRAFDAHAARVGEPLVAALGAARGGVRATFVDSLELFQDLPWSRTFLSEFRKRRGYDLEPWLPFVLQPGWMQTWGGHYSPPYFVSGAGEDLADRVRADYRQTVSDTLFDNFLQPLVQWNRQHGLKLKFQAHGGAIDMIKGYGIADIPETEDLHDGGDPHFMRFARSAVDIYGNRPVSAESMVWGNRPYSVTLDEMRKRADLLFASGVNAQTVHGFTYRFHEDKWPGWFAFQPTAFGTGFSSMLQESNPLWAGAPSLTGYLARTNAVLQQGRNVVPVALLYPEIGYYDGYEGPDADKMSAGERLLEGGYDYDRLNPDGLSGSRVENGRLVTPGGHAFDLLLMPTLASLRAETAETIARFAEQGLPVLSIGAMPSRETGMLDYPARDLRVRAAMARIVKVGGASVVPGELLPALARLGVRPNLQFVGDATGIFFIEKAVGTRRIYFLHNRGEAARDASFTVATVGKVENWDAMSGARSAVHSVPVAGGMRVELPLAAGASALLVIDPATPVAPVGTSRTLASLALPADGWALRVEGHGAGGTALTRDLGRVTLADWRQIEGLANFSGIGRYERVIQLPRAWSKRGRRVLMTLGGVHDMAVVTVNGKRLPPVISTPWSIDIGGAIRPGSNDIRIDIANVPQNAMIQSKAPGFKNLKPVAAGLVGSVSLALIEMRVTN